MSLLERIDGFGGEQEIEPGKRFLYELSRPGGRLFQVEFDLTAPVPLPPAPWGQ